MNNDKSEDKNEDENEDENNKLHDLSIYLQSKVNNNDDFKSDNENYERIAKENNKVFNSENSNNNSYVIKDSTIINDQYEAKIEEDMKKDEENPFATNKIEIPIYSYFYNDSNNNISIVHNQSEVEENNKKVVHENPSNKTDITANLDGFFNSIENNVDYHYEYEERNKEFYVNPFASNNTKRIADANNFSNQNDSRTDKKNIDIDGNRMISNDTETSQTKMLNFPSNAIDVYMDSYVTDEIRGTTMRVDEEIITKFIDPNSDISRDSENNINDILLNINDNKGIHNYEYKEDIKAFDLNDRTDDETASVIHIMDDIDENEMTVDQNYADVTMIMPQLDNLNYEDDKKTTQSINFKNIKKQNVDNFKEMPDKSISSSESFNKTLEVNDIFRSDNENPNYETDFYKIYKQISNKTAATENMTEISEVNIEQNTNVIDLLIKQAYTDNITYNHKELSTNNHSSRSQDNSNSSVETINEKAAPVKLVAEKVSGNSDTPSDNDNAYWVNFQQIQENTFKDTYETELIEDSNQPSLSVKESLATKSDFDNNFEQAVNDHSVGNKAIGCRTFNIVMPGNYYFLFLYI